MVIKPSTGVLCSFPAVYTVHSRHRPVIDHVNHSSWRPQSTEAGPEAGPALSTGAELQACTPDEGSLGRSRRGQTPQPRQPWPLHTQTQLSINSDLETTLCV